MSRINFNQLEKAEVLPSKLGMYKSNLKDSTSGISKNYDKKEYRVDPYGGVRRQILKSSIGQNWDEIVKLLKSKVPEAYLTEHKRWLLRRPDVMIQNSITGYWHWQDSDGDLSLYGYKTPRDLKHSGGNISCDLYYLDSQNRLKLIPRKGYVYHSKGPSKAEQRQANAYSKIVAFIKNKADVYRKFDHDLWRNYKYDTRKVEVPSTKKELQYNEFGNIVEVEIPIIINSYMTVEELKNWCKVNNKTYFIEVPDGYYTNLKLTYKQ